jgi:hypothetical protein
MMVSQRASGFRGRENRKYIPEGYSDRGGNGHEKEILLGL